MKLELNRVVNFAFNVLIRSEKRDREYRLQHLEELAGGNVGIYDRVRLMDKKAAAAQRHEEVLAVYRTPGSEIDAEVVTLARQELAIIQSQTGKNKPA